MILPMLIGSAIMMNAQSNWFIGVESSVLSSGIENQNPYEIEKLPAINTYGTSHSLLIGKEMMHGFAFSIAPTYAQLGQNYLDIKSDRDYLRNISLDYIQMPLMFSKNFGQKKMRIHTKAGIYGSYLVKSVFEESSLISEGSLVGPSITEVNSDRFDKFDLGFEASLGTQVAMSEKLSLNVNFKVATSITDINDKNYIYETGYKIDYKKSRNVYGGLGIGLKYHFY